MDAQRSPRLSLDLLRGFRAAARQLSFTRAAQELFLTQSAISRAIRTLEEQLGTPLFHRVNRVLRLTHEGEQLYRAVDEAIEAIDAAARRIAGSGRTLAVTTTVPLASMWLVAAAALCARSSGDRHALDREQRRARPGSRASRCGDPPRGAGRERAGGR